MTSTVYTKPVRDAMTPMDARRRLEDGHRRYRDKQGLDRDLHRQVAETKEGQWPFAAVLGCIDSRVPAELVFDQGIGDIFNIRIAGNFINDDILGSMEFACQVAGAKLIVVLGHSQCGAVKGACDQVQLGHLTGLLAKIQPAVNAVKEPQGAAERTSKNPTFTEEVALENVRQTAKGILSRSDVLRGLEERGEIGVVCAYYDVANGEVSFLESAPTN